MSIKFGKIEDVLTGNIWDNPRGGRVFYYNLVMDNGDKGNIGTKTQDSYVPGDTLYYKIEKSDKGDKFKKASNDEIAEFQKQNGNAEGQQPLPQPTVKNFGGRGSDASFALSYAKDFIGKAMEHQGRHDEDPISINQWCEATLVTAAKFNLFLRENA